MTAILAFLRLAWPYLAAFGVGGWASGWTVHAIDSASYARLQTTLASQQAQYAHERAAAQKAATDALRAQIQTRLITEASNGKVISQLQTERDAALAARDFSDRLLAAAAKTAPAARGGAVPTPAGGSDPDAASQSPGGGQLAELLRLAAAEAAQCFEHYTGLQIELQPQLKVSP